MTWRANAPAGCGCVSGRFPGKRFSMPTPVPQVARAASGWRGVLADGRSCVAGLEVVELNEGLAEYFEAEAGNVLVYDAEPRHPPQPAGRET